MSISQATAKAQKSATLTGREYVVVCFAKGDYDAFSIDYYREMYSDKTVIVSTDSHKHD